MADGASSPLRRPLVGCGVSVGLVACGLLLRQGLVLFFGPGLPPYATFFPAVMLAALLSGVWPGLLATALAAVLAALWVLSPGEFAIHTVEDAVGLGLFTGMGVFMSVVAELYRRSRQKAEAYQKELALRESEAQLRQALQAARMVSWSWDPLRDRFTVSDGFPEIYGRPPVDRLEDLRALTHPEDLPRHRAALDRVLREGGSCRTEFRVIRPLTGEVVWLDEQAGGEQDSAGRLVRAGGLVRDISARWKAEAALESIRATLRRERDILQTIMDCARHAHLVYLDREFNFVRVNEAYANTCGYTPEQMIGRNHFALYPDEENEAIFARARDTGLPAEFHDKPFVFPDQPQRGTTYWDWTLLPVKDDCGKVEGLVFSLIETTERKQFEQALQEANETLESRVAERTALAEARARQLQALAAQLTEAEERERKRIASILHDDLQQLLVATRYQLLALESLLQDRAAEMPPLQRAGELLELSVERSRSLSHELSPVLLRDGGLPAALEALARQMRERYALSVEVRVQRWNLERNESLQVFLYQAVQELLFNVVKHSGVRTASVHLEQLEDRVQVAVADAGRGFDPRTLSTAGGVGLLGVRERLGHLGGTLEVESAPGQGSRFTLTVPVQEPSASPAREVPAAPAEPPRGEAAKTDAPEAGRLRLLLADNHAVLRQGLIAILNRQPDILVVGEASDGEEALELALRLRPDVVVMDYAMPRMDGAEATRRIKQRLPGVRVIGLTMYPPLQTIHPLAAAGAEAVFSKDGRIEEILDAIRGKGLRIS